MQSFSDWFDSIYYEIIYIELGTYSLLHNVPERRKDS